MADGTTVVDAYIAMWNETDAEARRAIVAQAFGDDGPYLDPLMAGEGQDGIDAMVAGAQAQYPGVRFELTAGPDHHHDRVRFAWRMVGSDGAGELARGVDFATLAEDGRLRSVTGFLEPAEGAQPSMSQLAARPTGTRSAWKVAAAASAASGSESEPPSTATGATAA